MDINEYLNKISHLSKYKKDVLKLISTYDTTLKVDDSNGPKLYTYEINYFVNEADFSFEENLRVALYTYEFGIPLYSDPPVFVLAKSNPDGFGYIPAQDWQKVLKDASINPDIIKYIKDVLDSKPPVDY